MIIKTNSFVRRQTASSRFSHPLCEWDKVLSMCLDKPHRPGYRDGVILIDLDPGFFMSGVATLEEGDRLIGSFEARRAGETPRKAITATGKKIPAKSAYAVLYSSIVLAEDGSNELEPVEGNWELISINASPVEGEMPISPNVLLHNHFGSDGGTATGLSDSDFVAMLRESFNFWKDKAMVAAPEVQQCPDCGILFKE